MGERYRISDSVVLTSSRQTATAGAKNPLGVSLAPLMKPLMKSFMAFLTKTFTLRNQLGFTTIAGLRLEKLLIARWRILKQFQQPQGFPARQDNCVLAFDHVVHPKSWIVSISHT